MKYNLFQKWQSKQHITKRSPCPPKSSLSPSPFPFPFLFLFSPAYKKARNKRNTLHNFKILSLFFFLFPHYYKSNLMKVAPSRKHGRKARLVMLFTTPAHVKKNLSFLQWDPSFQLFTAYNVKLASSQSNSWKQYNFQDMSIPRKKRQWVPTHEIFLCCPLYHNTIIISVTITMAFFFIGKGSPS